MARDGSVSRRLLCVLRRRRVVSASQGRRVAVPIHRRGLVHPRGERLFIRGRWSRSFRDDRLLQGPEPIAVRPRDQSVRSAPDEDSWLGGGLERLPRMAIAAAPTRRRRGGLPQGNAGFRSRTYVPVRPAHLMTSPTSLRRWAVAAWVGPA